MNESFHYANVVTPVPASEWRELGDELRLALVKSALESTMKDADGVLEIVSAKEDGQVIARFKQPRSAAKRGALLLDFEAVLKESIDAGLVVWLESLNDRSSLRGLRGIGMKA